MNHFWFNQICNALELLKEEITSLITCCHSYILFPLHSMVSHALNPGPFAGLLLKAIAFLEKTHCAERIDNCGIIIFCKNIPEVSDRLSPDQNEH